LHSHSHCTEERARKSRIVDMLLDDLVALIEADENADSQRLAERANIQRIISERKMPLGSEPAEEAAAAPTPSPSTTAAHTACVQAAPASSSYLDSCVKAINLDSCVKAMGWKHAIMLRLVCKGTSEGSGEGWSTLCEVMASDLGLFLPRNSSGTYVKNKKIFFEHLYPARNKWAESEVASDFKIRVGVRFKPGPPLSNRDLVLPLHQRLKMLKKGEKISFEEAKGERGLPVELIEQLARTGVEVDADVLQMLQEAKQLACTVQNAETAARNEDRVYTKDEGAWESEGGGTVRGLTEEETRRVAETSGALMGGEGGSAATGRTSDQGGAVEEHGSDENEGQRRSKGKPRVLAVLPCKVVLYVPGLGVRPFHFVKTFDGQKATQQGVYEEYAQDAVVSALNGFNACFMAYGQTGSGKSHSTFGPQGILDRDIPEFGEISCDYGVVVRAACDVLDSARMARGSRCAFPMDIQVSMQYIQVYNENITDLLGGGNVALRTGEAGKVVLQGAAEAAVSSRGELIKLLRQGEARKRFAATAMNDHSSRAHTIVVLHLLHKTERGGGGLVRSELHMVDLAGCEQIKKSKVTGQAKREAVGINSSLCVLKKCIRALNEDKGHIPYMESKLTMLLRPAFGGSSRTYALITGSTDDRHMEETLQAVRFGEECSMISNHARQAASSLEGAAKAIDAALEQCESGMRSLEQRGKTHLAAFAKLKERFASLSRKRADLAMPSRVGATVSAS